LGGWVHRGSRFIEEGETVMYLVGKGHDHEGPGTSMVQRINWTRANEVQLMKSNRGIGPGLGDYGSSVPEFFSDCRAMSKGCNDFRGFGCACTKPGMNCGMGLFDTMNPTSWGWQEWAIVGAGGYMLTSMFFTGRRAGRQVREGVSKRVRGARKRLAAKVAG
jgi:hypothetical protein